MNCLLKDKLNLKDNYLLDLLYFYWRSLRVVGVSTFEQNIVVGKGASITENIQVGTSATIFGTMEVGAAGNFQR